VELSDLHCFYAGADPYRLHRFDVTSQIAYSLSVIFAHPFNYVTDSSGYQNKTDESRD
jgi:hypothetical protein